MRRVFLGQLGGCVFEFGPGGGGLVGVQTDGLEQVFVPVHHHGGALKRDAPSLAAGLAVLHERKTKPLSQAWSWAVLTKCSKGTTGLELVSLLCPFESKT